MKKDFEKLLRKLRRSGWAVSVTGGGHYRLDGPMPGVGPIFCSKTPGDCWALKKLVARLRKAGVDPQNLR